MSNQQHGGFDGRNPSAFFDALQAEGSSLPIPEVVSPDQIRNEAQRKVSSMFQDWELLRNIVERHEATIQRRWHKRLKEQRRKVLLSAWPEMATTHRPDLAAFQREASAQFKIGSKFRDAYLWPEINQEDLTKPQILPMFLNARARHTPDTFAMSDIDLIHFGLTSSAIVPYFLNEHTLVLTGRTSKDTYGQLQCWDDHPNAFDDMSNGKGLNPGEGLLVLERQERILGFLVHCCKELLQDIADDTLLDKKYEVQPEPQVAPADSVDFTSLAATAAELPYRVATLDLSRIVALCAARKSASEDHLWALREDPGYVAECLENYKEHRQKSMKDRKGNVHLIFKQNRQDVFWAGILKNELRTTYLAVQYWTELHRQAVHLHASYQSILNQISINQQLPSDLSNELVRFKFYLNDAVKGPLSRLQHSFAASPPMRPFFFRKSSSDAHKPWDIAVKKNGLKPAKVRDHLLWLMDILGKNDNDLFLVTLPVAVDELERLIVSEPSARSLISPYIANVLGDLTVIAECIRQINMFQPWAVTFEDKLASIQTEVEQEFESTMSPCKSILQAVDHLKEEELVRLGDPSDKKFSYPVDRRKTEQNIDAMRAAERNLDHFWAFVDKGMNEMHWKDQCAAHKMLREQRIVHRTAPWDPQESAQAAKSSSRHIGALCQPLSAVYFDCRGFEADGEKTPDVFSPIVPKIKEKTRGEPDTSKLADDTTNQPQPSSGSPDDKQPIFSLNKRALKVFKTLFYTPTASATPGEVQWADFLYAMTATGFLAEKLYGSVWQFSPMGLDVERSIQFHEPHPSAKMPYVAARRVGRRLSRAYGWHSDMFVLNGNAS